MTCVTADNGAVELYFYDELAPDARAEMSAHLSACRVCAAALEDLAVIRAALASRPDVSAPPAGDWSAFMQRLDAAVQPAASVVTPAASVATPVGSVVTPVASAFRRKAGLRPYIGLLATAALLALVTMSVWYAARVRGDVMTGTAQNAAWRDGGSLGDATPVATAGMRSLGEQHFERSKLVVLGLVSKEPGAADLSDWAYERELASSLLTDTRLYRLAAEERGLTSLAGVMRDLELVLLETSMAQGSDPAELPQIQRLIRKRQLVQKMDVVNTVGLLP